MGFDANQLDQEQALQAKIAEVNAAALVLIGILYRKVVYIGTIEGAQQVLWQVTAAKDALCSLRPASASADTSTEPSSAEPSPEDTTPETQPAPATSTPVGADKGKASEFFRGLLQNAKK